MGREDEEVGFRDRPERVDTGMTSREQAEAILEDLTDGVVVNDLVHRTLRERITRALDALREAIADNLVDPEEDSHDL